MGLTAAISRGLARVSIEAERLRGEEGKGGERGGENSNSAASGPVCTAPPFVPLVPLVPLVRGHTTDRAALAMVGPQVFN